MSPRVYHLRMLLAVLLNSLSAYHVVLGAGHASIKSKYGQLVTSSTLRWHHVTREGMRSQPIPEEAVPSGTGNPSRVICRAEHHGAMLTGQTVPGASCAVGFVNKMYKKHKYEILLNTDSSAKIAWQPYKRFQAVPEGAVAGVDATGQDRIFIGRFLAKESGKFLPGAIQVPEAGYSFGPMTVFDDAGSVAEVSDGDVMVELEPERYILEIRDSRSSSVVPKVTRQDIVLAKSSLFRFGEGRDQEARLQKVLSYDYEKSEYYGQVPGTIRALPATIRAANGQIHSILWGLPERSRQKETLMVGHSLKHQSAVDVSVVGVRVTEEHVYAGTLITIFPDGGRREREVSGTLQRKYLNNIRPEYSRVYQIKESIVVTADPNAKNGGSPQRSSSPSTTTPRPTSTWRSASSSSVIRREKMMNDENKVQKSSPVISMPSNAGNRVGTLKYFSESVLFVILSWRLGHF